MRGATGGDGGSLAGAGQFVGGFGWAIRAGDWRMQGGGGWRVGIQFGAEMETRTVFRFRTLRYVRLPRRRC